jgi:hypothetical protein
MAKKPLSNKARRPSVRQSSEKISEEEMIKLLERARQTVKPIVNREAANEVVGEDVLNFRMNA